jgi:hypothetical protein
MGQSTILSNLAARLQETNDSAITHLKRTLAILGYEHTLSLIAEAEAMVSQGGIPTNDNTRNRTLGGTFFYLVRRDVSWKDRITIFGLPPSQQAQMFSWKTRRSVYSEFNNPGISSSLQSTLSGKPIHVIIQPKRVILSFKIIPPTTGIAKDIQPPQDETFITAYVSRKHWLRLIEQGYSDTSVTLKGQLFYDEGLEGLSFYAYKLKHTPETLPGISCQCITSLNQVIIKKKLVLLKTIYNPSALTIPNYLPAAPTNPTEIMLYINRKSWKGIPSTLPISVEGFAYHDPLFSGITVSVRKIRSMENPQIHSKKSEQTNHDL